MLCLHSPTSCWMNPAGVKCLQILSFVLLLIQLFFFFFLVTGLEHCSTAETRFTTVTKAARIASICFYVNFTFVLAKYRRKYQKLKEITIGKKNVFIRGLYNRTNMGLMVKHGNVLYQVCLHGGISVRLIKELFVLMSIGCSCFKNLKRSRGFLDGWLILSLRDV